MEELVGAKAPGLIIEAVLGGLVGLGIRLGMKGEELWRPRCGVRDMIEEMFQRSL